MRTSSLSTRPFPSGQLLHDGEDKAYQAIVRRAQGKSNILDGIQLSVAALGIS